LVARWRQRALQMVEYARTIRRRDGAFDLVYRVVTGDVIRSKWPELFAFYHDEHMVEWIRHVTGHRAVCTSERILSGVNRLAPTALSKIGSAQRASCGTI
jgi:hypothetical protein